MADKKISDLSPAAALTGAEEVPIVQSAQTLRTTTAAIAALSTPPTGANPSATATGSAINGVATTFMRSDAAPAIQTFGAAQPGIVPLSGGGTTNFLRADGTWASPPAAPTGANPSATAGPNAINGVAATFMRSDAAPAIQLGSASVAGLLQGDGSTVSIAAGVLSVPGATASQQGGVTVDNISIKVTGHQISTPALNAFLLQFYGDGSDGNATITTTTTLARDMYYNNLTISGSGSLQPGTPTNGVWRIFVAGTLDISNAPSNAITLPAGNGGNGNTTVGGTAANPMAGGAIMGTNVQASAGSSGGTGAGTTNAGTSAVLSVMGGVGATSGAGGAVGGTAGGSAKAPSATQASPGQTGAFDLRTLTDVMGGWAGNTGGNATWVKPVGGQSAPGGSSGAGDGTGSGGGGGGGGNGGGVLMIFANVIARGTNSNAGIISAPGGNGGNGASGNAPTGTNHGGGGGGAGGGGGYIYLVYGTLTGSTITNCIDVTGGNGGAGANGVGTGIGGDGGGSGGGGRVDIYNLLGGTQTITGPTAAVAGNAHSGGTGGGALTATAHKVNL